MSRVHQLGHLRKPELIAIYLDHTGAIANGQATRHGYGPNDMTRDQLIAAIIHYETKPATQGHAMTMPKNAAPEICDECGCNFDAPSCIWACRNESCPCRDNDEDCEDQP